MMNPSSCWRDAWHHPADFDSDYCSLYIISHVLTHGWWRGCAFVQDNVLRVCSGSHLLTLRSVGPPHAKLSLARK